MRIAAFILFSCLSLRAAHFTNTTSLQFQASLSNSAGIVAGDTIWLSEISTNYFPPCTNSGLYGTNLVGGGYGWGCTLQGATNNVITIRPLPGHTVRIDRPWRFYGTNFIRFQDLEFYDSLKGFQPGISGNFGWVFFEHNTPNFEWVNCRVHDMNNAWAGSAAGSLIKGCVIWNVGYLATDHVTYNTSRRFSGNIVAWAINDALNLHLWPTTYVSSNIFFGTGQGVVTEDNGNDISIQSGDLTFIGNRHYNRRGSGTALSVSGNVVLSNNTLVASVPFGGYVPASFSALANTVVQRTTNNANNQVFSRSYTTGTWAFAANDYYSPTGPVKFSDPSGTLSFAQWRATYPAFDADSTQTSNALPANVVHVILNEDEPKRAHVAIYNWASNDNVTVSLSGVLNAGDTYQLYNAQNYTNGVMQSGTYNGTGISVPMTNLSVAAPLYSTNMAQGGLRTPPATSPEFGAFVVQGGESGSPKSISGRSIEIQGRSVVIQ